MVFGTSVHLQSLSAPCDPCRNFAILTMDFRYVQCFLQLQHEHAGKLMCIKTAAMIVFFDTVSRMRLQCANSVSAPANRARNAHTTQPPTPCRWLVTIFLILAIWIMNLLSKMGPCPVFWRRGSSCTNARTSRSSLVNCLGSTNGQAMTIASDGSGKGRQRLISGAKAMCPGPGVHRELTHFMSVCICGVCQWKFDTPNLNV